MCVSTDVASCVYTHAPLVTLGLGLHTPAVWPALRGLGLLGWGSPGCRGGPEWGLGKGPLTRA